MREPDHASTADVPKPSQDRMSPTGTPYGVMGDLYDVWRHREPSPYDRWTDFIHTRLTGAGNVMDVLDVACGTGAMMARLASLGYAVAGVDASEEMLRRARTNLGDSAKLELIRLPHGEYVEPMNCMGPVAPAAFIVPGGLQPGRGRFGFAPGRTPNELSSWTSLSQAALRLPAGTKAFETVTVTVPRNASSAEHYAVVWAQVSARAPAKGGLTLVNRVGVRMYLSIGPGGTSPPNFAIGRLTAKRSANGELLVVATIHNSGGRTLDIGGTLTLSNGPGGLRAGPFAIKLGTALAPHSSEPGTVRLDKRLPLGP